MFCLTFTAQQVIQKNPQNYMGSGIQAGLYCVMFLLHVVLTGVTCGYLACGVEGLGTRRLHSEIRHLGGGCYKAGPNWVSPPPLLISGPLHMFSPARQLDFLHGSSGL